MATTCMELWHLRALRLNEQSKCSALWERAVGKADDIYKRVAPKLQALNAQEHQCALLFFNSGWKGEELERAIGMPQNEWRRLLDDALGAIERMDHADAEG